MILLSMQQKIYFSTSCPWCEGGDKQLTICLEYKAKRTLSNAACVNVSRKLLSSLPFLSPEAGTNNNPIAAMLSYQTLQQGCHQSGFNNSAFYKNCLVSSRSHDNAFSSVEIIIHLQASTSTSRGEVDLGGNTLASIMARFMNIIGESNKNVHQLDMYHKISIRQQPPRL
jgi:hypothetical protein